MSCIEGWFINMLYAFKWLKNMNETNGMWIIADGDVDIKVAAYDDRAHEWAELLKNRH